MYSFLYTTIPSEPYKCISGSTCQLATLILFFFKELALLVILSLNKGSRHVNCGLTGEDVDCTCHIVYFVTN